MRGASWLIAALAAGFLATGCWGGRAVSAPRSAPPSCPVTAASAALGPTVRSVLVPTGPVTASVCQYATGLPAAKSAGLARRIALRGPAAAGLAAVLDSSAPLTASARGCDRGPRLLPFAQEIVFGYRTAAARTVVLAYTDCDLAVVTTGGSSGVLAGQPETDLFSYTSIRLSARGPGTPDLIGLTAQAAQTAAGRRGFTLFIDGAVIDQQASAGTVVFQVPPPGVVTSGPGAQVGVILAAHREPGCATRQLTLSYRGGGAGAGNDFGTLLIRDASTKACTLAGRLLVTGVDASGRSVTATVRFPVTGVAVLSPAARTASPVDQQRDQLAGQLGLIAEYRDDPVSGELCNPFWVVPADWRVVFPGGQALITANAAPGNPAPTLVPSGGFVTCRGQLSALQPAYVGAP